MNLQQHREQQVRAMQGKLINRVLDHALTHYAETKWRTVAMALLYGASLKTAFNTGKALALKYVTELHGTQPTLMITDDHL